MLKDPRSRVTLFVPPILQCLIFGYAATYDLNDVPYAVLDQDRSAASRELLAAARRLGRVPAASPISNGPTTSTTVIDERRALLVVQIDQDFERRLRPGQPADVQVIADGRNSNTAGTALGYVGAIVDGFNADWRADPRPAGAAGRTSTARAWYNPNLETRWNMIPALIGTLTLLQTLLLTAMSVAREREQGTFDQLLVTPFRPAEIMVGKALPSMLVGIVQATIILLVAQLWFRIPFVGLVRHALRRAEPVPAGGGRHRAARLVARRRPCSRRCSISFVLMMPFTLLSGLATPISNMPRRVPVPHAASTRCATRSTSPTASIWRARARRSCCPTSGRWPSSRR